MTQVADVELVAGDIMSRPVAAVRSTASAWEAWNVALRDHIRHVVVVDAHRRCLGVLTEADLVAAWDRGPHRLATTPVRDLLAERTACVLSDAPVRQVAALMNQERVDAVPVVDEHHDVLGLITAGDIVHAVSIDGVHHERPDG